MRSYEAISYTIDGVLPSGCLYGPPQNLEPERQHG